MGDEATSFVNERCRGGAGEMEIVYKYRVAPPGRLSIRHGIKRMTVWAGLHGDFK
jgi:hypothetical protein